MLVIGLNHFAIQPDYYSVKNSPGLCQEGMSIIMEITCEEGLQNVTLSPLTFFQLVVIIVTSNRGHYVFTVHGLG